MALPTIAIGNDHAGTAYKIELKAHLEANGYQVINFGTDTNDSTDYADYIHPLSDKVESGDAEFGIAICGSANGVSMTANKHQGIRAAICWQDKISKLAREHNNANVLCLPARFISIQEAISIVDIFINTDFEGGRHKRRIDKIPCT